MNCTLLKFIQIDKHFTIVQHFYVGVSQKSQQKASKFVVGTWSSLMGMKTFTSLHISLAGKGSNYLK